MNVKVKSDYFITLAEAKIHLRLDADYVAEDSYVTQLIKAATGFAENYINMDIAQTANTLTLNSYSGNIILINEGNYRSVTSVTGEISGEIDSGAYETVYTKSNFTITLDDSINDENMTIVFETGYVDSTYPVQIEQAILIKLHDLYDPQRGSFNIGVIKENAIFTQLLNYYVGDNFIKSS